MKAASVSETSMDGLADTDHILVKRYKGTCISKCGTLEVVIITLFLFQQAAVQEQCCQGISVSGLFGAPSLIFLSPLVPNFL